eukprot:3080783-Amphidinium_carterae.1
MERKYTRCSYGTRSAPAGVCLGQTPGGDFLSRVNLNLSIRTLQWPMPQIFLRHQALKLDYPNPAFGKNVEIYTSQDKQKVKSLEPRGMVGRFLMCNTWWTGAAHIFTQEEEEFIVNKGLKPIRADPDMVQLAKP